LLQAIHDPVVRTGDHIPQTFVAVNRPADPTIPEAGKLGFHHH